MSAVLRFLGSVDDEDEEAAHRELTEYADQHLPPGPYTATVQTGAPAETIVRKAQELEADLIVVGTREHGRVSQALLGSTTDRVLRQAPCPVLVVNAP